MRITVLTSPFCELPPDAIGAIERLWSDICEEFAAAGHSVQLIGKKGQTALANGERIVRTYINGFSRTGRIAGDVVLDFVYSVRALRRIAPCDVLVCNTFWSPLLAPLLISRRFRTLVYNVARFPKMHLKLYRAVDIFACTSKAVKKALLEIAPGTVRKTVAVVNNPIDTDVFNKSSRSAPCEGLSIGYHGRIHPEKGLDILAQTVADLAASFPRLHIEMIGAWDVASGGGGEAYKRRLDDLSGGRIVWRGPISDRRELAVALSRCTVYCYPSIAERGETFGVAPLEAMGLGLPVVVSALDCFSDFIDDGINGVVFDHRCGNASCGLGVALLRLLRNEEERQRLGDAAAARAASFSTREIARRYIELFSSIDVVEDAS